MIKNFIDCVLGDSKYQILEFSKTGPHKEINQDSIDVYHDDEQIIISVCDGLGSAKNSKEGSKAASEIIVDLLKSGDDYSLLWHSLSVKWRALFKEETDSYDTTVKFIKISKKSILCGGIGDGWISILTDKNYYSLTVDNVFSNQTDSILSFDLKDKFKVKKIDNEAPITMLISTDGFSEDLEKDKGELLMKSIDSELNTNTENFINDIINMFENWPNKTNTDDKSVVILRRR